MQTKLHGTAEAANVSRVPSQESRRIQVPVDFAGLVAEGAAILRYQSNIVAKAIASASEITIGGYKVLAVNATTLQSEIAGELAKSRPFGACFFLDAWGVKVWSLRSREGGVDVSEVAKLYGGGGHVRAAGFQEKHDADGRTA